MTQDRSIRSKALGDSVRAFAPLLIAVVPFGLVFGIVAAGSDVGPWLGGATSFIIFAGAAQLATLQLIDAGAAGAVVVATALVINARHFMYSAALAPAFREFPRGARIALPYLLTDQAFALSIVRFGEVEDPLRSCSCTEMPMRSSRKRACHRARRHTCRSRPVPSILRCR